MGQVHSSNISLSRVKENSIGVLPSSPNWRQLEPNTISEIGPTISTVRRNPLKESSRVLDTTPTIVDKDSFINFEHDLTIDFLTDVLPGLINARGINDFVQRIPIYGAVSVASGTSFSFGVKSPVELLNYRMFEQGSIFYISGFVDPELNRRIEISTTILFAANEVLEIDIGDTECIVTGYSIAVDIPVSSEVIGYIDFCGHRSIGAALHVLGDGSITLSNPELVASLLCRYIQLGQLIHIGSVFQAYSDIENGVGKAYGYGRLIEIIDDNTIRLDKVSDTLKVAGSTLDNVDIVFTNYLTPTPRTPITKFLEHAYCDFVVPQIPGSLGQINSTSTYTEASFIDVNKNIIIVQTNGEIASPILTVDLTTLEVINSVIIDFSPIDAIDSDSSSGVRGWGAIHVANNVMYITLEYNAGTRTWLCAIDINTGLILKYFSVGVINPNPIGNTALIVGDKLFTYARTAQTFGVGFQSKNIQLYNISDLSSVVSYKVPSSFGIEIGAWIIFSNIDKNKIIGGYILSNELHVQIHTAEGLLEDYEYSPSDFDINASSFNYGLDNWYLLVSKSIRFGLSYILFVTLDTGSRAIKLTTQGHIVWNIPVPFIPSVSSEFSVSSIYEVPSYNQLNIDETMCWHLSLRTCIIDIDKGRLDIFFDGVSIDAFLPYNINNSASKFYDVRTRSIIAHDSTLDKFVRLEMYEPTIRRLGYIEEYFQFELSHPNLGSGLNTTSTSYLYLEGHQLNSMAINLEVANKIALETEWVGLDTSVPTGVKKVGTLEKSEYSDIFNTTLDIPRLDMFNLSNVNEEVLFKRLAIRFTNNVQAVKVLAKLGPKYLHLGRLGITIEANILFSNPFIVSALNNGIPLSIDTIFENENGVIHLDLQSFVIAEGNLEYVENEVVKYSITCNMIKHPNLGSALGFSYIMMPLYA